MAAKFNFDIDQGTDFEYVLTIKDSDTLVPIDITGFTFESYAKVEIDGVKSFEFTFIIFPDQVLDKGKVSMILSNVDSSSIGGDEVKFIYDVEQTDLQPKKSRIMQGEITLSREVTK